MIVEKDFIYFKTERKRGMEWASRLPIEEISDFENRSLNIDISVLLSRLKSHKAAMEDFIYLDIKKKLNVRFKNSDAYYDIAPADDSIVKNIDDYKVCFTLKQTELKFIIDYALISTGDDFKINKSLDGVYLKCVNNVLTVFSTDQILMTSLTLKNKTEDFTFLLDADLLESINSLRKEFEMNGEVLFKKHKETIAVILDSNDDYILYGSNIIDTFPVKIIEKLLTLYEDENNTQKQQIFKFDMAKLASAIIRLTADKSALYVKFKILNQKLTISAKQYTEYIELDNSIVEPVEFNLNVKHVRILSNIFKSKVICVNMGNHPLLVEPITKSLDILDLKILIGKTTGED